MGLQEWLESKSTEEIQTLVDGIESGTVPDDRVSQLRDRIEDTPRVKLERISRAVDGFDAQKGGMFNPLQELQEALGLEPTPPAAPSAVQTEDVEIDGTDDLPGEDRQEAINSIEPLLGTGAGRGAEFFEALANALEQNDADESTFVTQETLDALTEDDRETFAERARDLADQVRDASGTGTLADRRDKSAGSTGSSSGGGGGGGPDLPGGLGPRSERGDDLGDADPFVDEDYMDGEPITRDPEFEERFIELARRLGRARDLDLQPQPGDYFGLTKENQRKFYDVTPAEFIERAVNRGEVTRAQLRRMGFSDDLIPDD